MRNFFSKWIFCFVPVASLLASPFGAEIESCKRGEGCFDFDQEEEPSFFAFVSFSMPESLWFEMSKGLEENGGTFVLRGMPNNSFQEFAIKLLEYRKKGINAPINIDPDAFEEYQITSVPTFVLDEGRGYRKIEGNVSISYALKKLKGEGI